jgi:hypothetical protein
MLGALKAYEKAMRGSPAEQPNLLWLIEALHKADAAIRKAEEGA